MRSKQAPKRKIKEDPIYENKQVAKLVNRSMLDGKKSLARKHVYQAFQTIEKKLKKDPLEAFRQALENVKPQVEVRTRRVGGAAYQVPTSVKGPRRNSLAIRWLIQAARDRDQDQHPSYSDKLAAEIMDAYNSQGAAVKRKEDTHKQAEANKAFAHFRWWSTLIK